MDRTEPRPRRRADGEELQQALAGWLDRDRIESARGAVRALGEQETNPRDTEARLLEVAADAPRSRP